jgi:Ribonuclease G/E
MARKVTSEMIGNIYKGVVCRVLPGMQAAFVEIGLERAAFLHISGLCSKEARKVTSEMLNLCCTRFPRTDTAL